MTVELKDELSPYIQKLVEVSPNLANEALGRSGKIVRDKMMSIARRKGNANTGFYFKGGKRKLLSSDKGGSKRLFSRYSHSTGEEEKIDMADFVRFKVYDHSNFVLVGFMDVKGWRPIKYRKGQRSGYWSRKKGTVVKKIGQLYEYGGRVDLTERQKAFLKASGWHKAAKRGYVKREAHPVVSVGWMSSKGAAIDKFEQVFYESMGAIA